MCLQIIYSIYMYKKDLALINLLWLICHKTKLNNNHLFAYSSMVSNIIIDNN